MNKINEINNRIKSKKNIKDNNVNKNFNFFIIKFFIMLIIFSLATLTVKNDSKIKSEIYNKIYNNNFSFAFFKNQYNKYIGNIIPFKKVLKDTKVFNEKLEYNSLSRYNKGVKLSLNQGYSIPIIKGGLVIFVGEKEGLGKTVIINQTDGIDTWYSNLSSTNMKLYDYVDDNAILGEAKDNELYLLFQKNGVEIDYKNILK